MLVGDKLSLMVGHAKFLIALNPVVGPGDLTVLLGILKFNFLTIGLGPADFAGLALAGLDPIAFAGLIPLAYVGLGPYYLSCLYPLACARIGSLTIEDPGPLALAVLFHLPYLPKVDKVEVHLVLSVINLDEVNLVLHVFPR